VAIRVAVSHRTRYVYGRPVAMTPQVIRLRPAPHTRTPIHSYSLRIEPTEHFLNWQQDPYGNYLARVVIPEKTVSFGVTVDLVADLEAFNPFDFFIEPYAEKYPFVYAERVRRELAPFLLAEPASPSQLLSPDLALANKTTGSARKALAGFTWTHETGWSILGETWWDGTAPSAEDWQRLSRQARQRNALAALPGVPAAAVAGSLAASTRMFQQPNVSRHAALAHIAWSDPQGGRWSGGVDLLRSLDDGGYSLTAAVSWQADRLRLDAGVRRFGGKPDSAYRLMPERGIVFAGASLAF